MTLANIKHFYSVVEQKYPQFLLKEYLQYQILKIVYDSPYGEHLVFLWGTAIRLIYWSTRFSEDLDFDNFWLSEEDFLKFSDFLWFELRKLGYEIEINSTLKWAYHCYIRLPKILKSLWFSAFDDEKILIQLDPVKQDFYYISDKILLDKFDVFKMIQVCPVDILLSKKIVALLQRKRTKWRDFFDVAFLQKLTSPHYEYLQEKMEIWTSIALKEQLLSFCRECNLLALSKDVLPFLINRDEVGRVENFEATIQRF